MQDPALVVSDWCVATTEIEVEAGGLIDYMLRPSLSVVDLLRHAFHRQCSLKT
jgi:hypothetical protein